MDPRDKNPKAKRLICFCNAVSQAQIEEAIAGGCTSLGKIFDSTTAGVGACGGSCQPTLRKMLDAYLKDGKFLEDPRPPGQKKRKRRA